MNQFKTRQSTHPKIMVWTDPETGIQHFSPIESKGYPAVQRIFSHPEKLTSKTGRLLGYRAVSTGRPKAALNHPF